MATLHTFEHREDLTSLDAAWLTALAGFTRVRQANGANHDTWTDCHPGGANKLCVIVNAGYPAVDYTRWTLDSEIDWRDRILLVSITYAEPTSPAIAFPGVSDELFTALAPNAATYVHYTHAGEAAGLSHSGTPTGKQIKAVNTDRVLLYADSIDGSLVLERSSNDTYTGTRAFMIRIIASERIGVRRTAPPAVPSFAAVDGNPIDPADLLNLQDKALLSQASGDVCDCMGLGPVVRGSPAVPEVWTVRGEEVRQPVVGAVRRWFGVQVANSATVTLDDSVDWRDRLLWGMGRQSSANDIRAGHADDDTHNTATAWSRFSKYTGPGADGSGMGTTPNHYMALEGAVTLGIFADEDTGELKIRNETGATRYVSGMIEGSFQLGPRSA